MKTSTSESHEKRILQVLSYIQSNLDEDLKLEDLARRACFSPFHFHRVFKAQVGESVASHVRRLRLDRAAWGLRFTERSVTELAWEAGYESLEAFIRALKDRFGLSPTIFRNRARSNLTKRMDLARRSENYVKKGACGMDIEIKKLEARKVAYVRHMGPYDQCTPAWEKLCAWAGPKGLLGPEVDYLGICWDDPDVTEEDRIRFDACITVPEEVQAEQGINITEVPSGDYAVALHKGSYDKLIDSYTEMCGEWLAKSGRQAESTFSIEIYLNHPDEVAAEELMVEIQMPLS
ncbi:AraC family transcriptional regulator [Dethiosulfatarculus sandiegensis]|uniref:AraC family transcriptional regulator n=1 Tax=Dethiosulfatarculus sandiegensis TaxID=1429043 RepID=A0A0D2JAL9_9BACT|nr:AraC family transcriptional regulator [Dethiosulfatarculus sandiegensis]KIX15174.1 AraC family transcriptional regulator [Dethiosulfatarculus sandiegensis]